MEAETRGGVKFGNNDHPAVKDLMKMPIRKIARIAHYFGMSLMPEPAVEMLVTEVTKVKEKLPHYRELETAVNMYFDDDKRFKPVKTKDGTADHEVVALERMSNALKKLAAIDARPTKKVKRKKVRLKRKKLR